MRNDTTVSLSDGQKSFSVNAQNVSLKEATASGAFTITAYYEDVDTTGGAASTTLPSANSVVPGTTYVFTDYRFNSLINNITISAAGGDTCGNASSCVLNSNGESITVHSDGINEWIRN